MARLNDEGQWIVLMGLLVAVALFFLALVVNQSALIGQTTTEGVLEFPKSDIRDLRSAVFDYVDAGRPDGVYEDIVEISLDRKNAVVSFEVKDGEEPQRYRVTIHYNNGMTVYNETTYY
ncbi:MAG: hypothetical protein GX882_09010 [Methanomicrobiales archaeon]|nr:hypothetical protein [Methanomicrobiales archaeon]